MSVKALFTSLSLILLSGCATSIFTVKSDPLQSDVFFLDPKTGDKKPLGKTPLEMPTAELKTAVGEGALSGEFFTVEVEKQGYVPEKFIIPATRFGTLVTALDVKLKPGAAPKEERIAKEILNHLFLAQRMALTGQYERAQIELDKILSETPDFPRALSMRGSIYYVQKNYPESLKWYEEALKADPQMEDAVQMVAKIRAIQKGERPAPGGAPARAPAKGAKR